MPKTIKPNAMVMYPLDEAWLILEGPENEDHKGEVWVQFSDKKGFVRLKIDASLKVRECRE